MFKGIRRYITALSVLLLTIFTVYYATIAFYTHAHILNGVTVMHAHPFHGEHSHSQGQLLLLNLFSHFCSEEAGDIVDFPIPIRPYLYTLEDEYKSPAFVLDFVDGLFLRGPPSFSIFSI